MRSGTCPGFGATLNRLQFCGCVVALICTISAVLLGGLAPRSASASSSCESSVNTLSLHHMRFFKPRSSFLDLPSVALTPESIRILHEARQILNRPCCPKSQRPNVVLCCVAYICNTTKLAKKFLEALYRAKHKRPHLQVTVFVDWHRGQRGLIGEEKSPESRWQCGLVSSTKSSAWRHYSYLWCASADPRAIWRLASERLCD